MVGWCTLGVPSFLSPEKVLEALVKRNVSNRESFGLTLTPPRPSAAASAGAGERPGGSRETPVISVIPDMVKQSAYLALEDGVQPLDMPAEQLAQQAASCRSVMSKSIGRCGGALGILLVSNTSASKERGRATTDSTMESSRCPKCSRT